MTSRPSTLKMNKNMTIIPNRPCEDPLFVSDTCRITELTEVLTDLVAKPIASLIVGYSFEDIHKRHVRRLVEAKCLSDEARIVLQEYSGVSWVAESVTGYIPRDMALGVNVQHTPRQRLRYNTTEHGCTYGQFFELLIVRIDVYSNRLFLDYRSKHDETSGVIHNYRKPEISIPLTYFQDISLSGLDGFCACGGYHKL